MIRSASAARALSLIVALCILGSGCAQVKDLPTGVRSGSARATNSQATGGTDPAQAAALRAAAGLSPGEQGFYPLAVGNLWVYSGSSYRWVWHPGSDTSATRTTWVVRDSVVGRQVLDGHEYFRIERVEVHEAVVTPPLTYYLRQDRTGLYERGPTIPLQPGTEHLTVAYPLHARASWRFGSSTALVEGRELVETPLGRFPAWRVRLDTDGADAGTITHMWLGACGRIGIVDTMDREYLSREGERIVLHGEMREWLSFVQLVDGPHASQEAQVP